MANASTIVMLWVAGMLVITGQLTMGELVAFYAYLLQIVGPVRQGGFLMSMASRATHWRNCWALSAPFGSRARPSVLGLDWRGGGS